MNIILLPMRKLLRALFLFCFCLGSFGLLASEGKEPLRPNIIIIITDDQGYGDMSRHGNTLLQTPNMDRLHDESVRLERFYVASSCAPTRSALMTGIHYFRNGVTHTIPPRSNTALNRVFLPEILRGAGYETGFIGKWHLGTGTVYAPQSRGFNYNSTIQEPTRNHFDPVVIRNGQIIQKTGFREDVLFDEAMLFIEENQDKPFFCYLASWSPHTPLKAPAKDIAPFAGKVSEEVATFLGMVSNLDQNLGRLLNKLEELKLTENTVLLFMNDNGGTYGVDVNNSEMRGTKATSWEGGFRAFAFWRWLGEWAPGQIDNLTDATDILPTICELAGAEIPECTYAELDGYSLVSLLSGKSTPGWVAQRTLFHHNARWAGGTAEQHKYAEAAVFRGDFLLARREVAPDPDGLGAAERQGSNLLLNWVANNQKPSQYSDEALYHWALTDGWELYSLVEDPACTIDLSEEMPGLVNELAKEYGLWWDEVYPEMIENGGDAVLVY